MACTEICDLIHMWCMCVICMESGAAVKRHGKRLPVAAASTPVRRHEVCDGTPPHPCADYPPALAIAARNSTSAFSKPLHFTFILRRSALFPPAS